MAEKPKGWMPEGWRRRWVQVGEATMIEDPPAIKRGRGRPVVRTDEVLEMIRQRVNELVAEGMSERKAVEQIASEGGFFHQVGRANMKPGPDGKRKSHKSVWDDPERLWQEYMEAKRRHRTRHSDDHPDG